MESVVIGLGICCPVLCHGSITREKERRVRGQQLSETQEERERMLRKLEAEKIKREKQVRGSVEGGLSAMRVVYVWSVCRTDTYVACVTLVWLSRRRRGRESDCAPRSLQTRRSDANMEVCCPAPWGWRATTPPQGATPQAAGERRGVGEQWQLLWLLRGRRRRSWIAPSPPLADIAPAGMGAMP